MSKKKIILIAIFIIIIALIIGLILFIKQYPIYEFEKELSKTENYGGKILINIEKDMNKTDKCIYFIDKEYNSSTTNSETPIQVTVFSINKDSKLKIAKEENWTRSNYNEFLQHISNLKKYEQNSDRYIKIRDYNSEYYVDLLNLKFIIDEYFI